MAAHRSPMDQPHAAPAVATTIHVAQQRAGVSGRYAVLPPADLVSPGPTALSPERSHFSHPATQSAMHTPRVPPPHVQVATPRGRHPSPTPQVPGPYPGGPYPVPHSSAGTPVGPPRTARAEPSMRQTLPQTRPGGSLLVAPGAPPNQSALHPSPSAAAFIPKLALPAHGGSLHAQTAALAGREQARSPRDLPSSAVSWSNNPSVTASSSTTFVAGQNIQGLNSDSTSFTNLMDEVGGKRPASDNGISYETVEHLARALQAERQERESLIAEIRTAMENVRCLSEVSRSEVAQLRVMTVELQATVRNIVEERQKEDANREDVTELATSLRKQMQDLCAEAKLVSEAGNAFKEVLPGIIENERKLPGIIERSHHQEKRIRSLEDVFGNLVDCVCIAKEAMERNGVSLTEAVARSEGRPLGFHQNGAAQPSNGHESGLDYDVLLRQAKDQQLRPHEWADSGEGSDARVARRGCTREEPPVIGELPTIVEARGEDGREDGDGDGDGEVDGRMFVSFPAHQGTVATSWSPGTTVDTAAALKVFKNLTNLRGQQFSTSRIPSLN